MNRKSCCMTTMSVSNIGKSRKHSVQKHQVSILYKSLHFPCQLLLCHKRPTVDGGDLKVTAARLSQLLTLGPGKSLRWRTDASAHFLWNRRRIINALPREQKNKSKPFNQVPHAPYERRRWRFGGGGGCTHFVARRKRAAAIEERNPPEETST